MADSRTLLPAIKITLLLIFLGKSTAHISHVTPQTSQNAADNHHLIREIEEAQIEVAHLESILEERISNLNLRNLRITKGEMLIEEMTSEVDRLQSVSLNLKDDSPPTNERINELEEEVRYLWAVSRTNNFQIHNLESAFEDAQNRFEEVVSRVNMMESIVTEMWFQIQQHEQALHIAEVKLTMLKRQVGSLRCPFLKFFRNHFDNLLENSKGMLARTFLASKDYHHQLQVFVRNEMEKGKHTAALANAEVVFFMASALIVFPALSVIIFLLNNFG